MKTNIGISAANLKAVASEMNKVLADEFVLYTKTRNYHWNIEGSNFMELHKFYESQFEQFDQIIDDVAERIRSIGHTADARLKDYLKNTHLEEPDYTNDQQQQMKNLLNDHETIIRNLRDLIDVFSEKHKDEGSADFVTGLMQEHEKMAWFIRSYIK